MRFDIGSYIYYTRLPSYSLGFHESSDRDCSDILNSVKSFDDMLHQSLEILNDNPCSRPDPQYNNDQDSKLQILEQEPFLSKYFSKEELGKLSYLWIAVLCCYEKSAELLLVRSGADVNELFGRHDPQVIDEKSTILHLMLHMVISPEKERLILLVIDQGADLQARDSTGQTILHYALTRNIFKVVEMLLKKGADVNAADNDGITPLLVAVGNYKADELVPLLLEKGADVNVADNDGITPLLAAIGNSKAKELVPLLIKHGADVSAKSREGQNVLHRLACGSSKEHIVDLARILIEKGAPLDDKEHFYDYQPLHRAITMGKIELVEVLLEHGANVDALTSQGESALHIAAQSGHSTLVENFLKRGQNINLRANNGRTALHVACEYHALHRFDDNANESENIIRLLVSAGADLLIEDVDGCTPFVFITSYEMRDGNESPWWKWPATCLMVRALALKKACHPSLGQKCDGVMRMHSKLWNYYQECIEEIDKLISTNFIESCTFFELLTKSPCQINALMQNPDFELKFNLYDISAFCFAEEIRRAFERGLEHYNTLLEQANLINEAVYNILPYLIVRKVVAHIYKCCKNFYY